MCGFAGFVGKVEDRETCSCKYDGYNHTQRTGQCREIC